MRALACPASLKGVLSAAAAAEALAEGLTAGGAEAEELPVADGGEGTLDVLQSALGGEWREAVVSDPLGRPVSARWLLLPDGAAAVESATAIGFGLVAEDERDVLRASSRGLGELVEAALAAEPSELTVFLGGTATVDGGAGFLEKVEGFPIPVRAGCDVRATLYEAVSVFAVQKGATPDQLPELERRLRHLEGYRDLPGGGAAGGLGAALASLGAELVAGAPLVLGLIGFGERLVDADLVITGEGTVDRSTWMGKAPSAVLEASRPRRCIVFGGVVLASPEDVEVYELSGDRARAREDLVELGISLATAGTTGRTA